MEDKTQKICPNCGGQMTPDLNKGVFRCPNCDTEIMLEESDDVRKERIKQATIVDVAEKKIQAEKKMHQEKQKTERAISRDKNTRIILIIVAGIIAVVTAIVFFAYKSISETVDNATHPGQVKITEDLSSLNGLDNLTVRAKLSTAGFTNIEMVPQNDLGPMLESKEGITDYVTINENRAFRIGEWFEPDVAVAVYYHSLADHELDGIQALQDSDYYKNQDYGVAMSDFTDAGFSNIELKPLKDLDPDSNKMGLVEKVAINGNAKFSYIDLFPDNSVISISYHSVKRQKLFVGTSSEDFKKKDYKAVIEMLKSAGFYNFEYALQTDASLFVKKNTVESVTIGGVSEFSSYSSFYEDETVVIAIHIAKKDKNEIELELKPEGRAGMPLSAKSMVGKDYREIVQQLKDAGFTNVITVPNPDLKKGFGLFKKKDGEIQSVSANGINDFAKNDIFAVDDMIRIVYHTYPDSVLNIDVSAGSIPISFGGTDVKLRDYKTVVEEFESLGFTNIKTEAIADIDENSDMEDGAVERVTVNGEDDFEINSIFDKDVEVIISYHTKKE